MPRLPARLRVGALVLSAYVVLAMALAAWLVFMAVMFDDFFFVPAPVTVVASALVALALPAALLALTVAVLRGSPQAAGMARGVHIAVALLGVILAGVVLAHDGGPRALVFPLALLAAGVVGTLVMHRPARGAQGA